MPAIGRLQKSGGGFVRLAHGLSAVLSALARVLLVGLPVGRVDDAIALAGTVHTVSGNKVVKPAFDGIYVPSSASSAQLLDNIVIKAKDDGIDVEAFAVNASGNKVKKSADNGLEINGVGNTIAGNSFLSSGTLDINDSTGGGNTYADNVFETSNLP